MDKTAAGYLDAGCWGEHKGRAAIKALRLRATLDAVTSRRELAAKATKKGRERVVRLILFKKGP